MRHTHTYTLHADEPYQQVTLTLTGRHLFIASDASSLQLSALAETQAVEPLTIQYAPMIDVTNVNAGLTDDDLRLAAWSRTPDRHWRLIAFMLEHVQNPDTARAFVVELHRLQIRALQRARLAAWLHARGRWFLAGNVAALLLLMAIRFTRAHFASTLPPGSPDQTAPCP